MPQLRAAIPGTLDFAGGVPAWMRQLLERVCSEADVANVQKKLYTEIFRLNGRDPDTQCAIQAMQIMFAEIGFDVGPTGMLDAQTVFALKYRIGPTYETTKIKDIIWELKAHKDSGFWYGSKPRMASSPKKLTSQGSLFDKAKTWVTQGKTYGIPNWALAAGAGYFIFLRK